MWIIALLFISYGAVERVNGCVEVSMSTVSTWTSGSEDHTQAEIVIDPSGCSDSICDVDLSIENDDAIYHSWSIEQESSGTWSTLDWAKWTLQSGSSITAGFMYTGDDEVTVEVSGYTTCDGESVTDVTPGTEDSTTEGSTTTTTGGTTVSTTEYTGTPTSAPSTTSSEMCLLGDYATGQTTRYWDCCKVSCGWSGKMDPGDDYVDSCSSDGETVLSGNSDTSGCDGGTAYTCTSNMPWAVTDNLAYGYVAAAVPDLDETAFCCGCYHVIFTDTSIAGKEMIVQVTNIGYDLSSGGHFDIQMPGGGVGLFDGCSSQWGSGYDWGAQYGGISEQEECDNLPSELSDGCNWRFDWFENADNPNMEYAAVECPQELIDNSGCEREDWSC